MCPRLNFLPTLITKTENCLVNFFLRGNFCTKDVIMCNRSWRTFTSSSSIRLPYLYIILNLIQSDTHRCHTIKNLINVVEVSMKNKFTERYYFFPSYKRYSKCPRTCLESLHGTFLQIISLNYQAKWLWKFLISNILTKNLIVSKQEKSSSSKWKLTNRCWVF